MLPSLCLALAAATLVAPPLSSAAAQSGLPICEEDKRRPEDATSPNATAMGESIAVDGDFAVVGGPHADNLGGSGFDWGAAWIFKRDATTTLNAEQRWFREQLVQDPVVPSSFDMFGRSVAISGDRVVVGSSNDNHSGVSLAGSAFVFKRNAATGQWAYEPPVLRAPSPMGGDFFGYSVAIDNVSATDPPRIIVGAQEIAAGSNGRPGSARVFEWITPAGQQQPTWVHQATLLAGDHVTDDSAEFGHAVAIDGDNVIVGAPFHDHAGVDSGGAYVFVGGGTSWSAGTELPPSTFLTNGDLLGMSVDIDGDTAVVGAPRDEFGTLPADAGAVYVFENDGTSWNLAAQLTASDPIAQERFGIRVGIDSGRIVVGTRPLGASGGERAFLFEYDPSSSSWQQKAILTSGNAAVGAEFGCSVAISGDSVAIGAPNDDTTEVTKPSPPSGYAQSGAAYFFAPFADTHNFYGVPEDNHMDCGGAGSNSGSYLSVLPNQIPSVSGPGRFDIIANDVTFVSSGPGRRQLRFRGGPAMGHRWAPPTELRAGDNPRARLHALRARAVPSLPGFVSP